jgi:nicotinamidase-related amidase
MSKTALILVDIQNDYFEGGDWPVANMQTVATNAARLLDHARSQGDMVVHVRHEMPSDAAPFFRPGSKGAEINASVAPAGNEPVIVKSRPNSFVGTDLLDRLQQAEVKAVVICGAMSQMCIDATARAAVDFGFQVSVAQDACGAKEMSFGAVALTAEQVHAAFMAPLAMSYAEVVNTEDLIV